jgi:Mg2+ and Co2+ transporter CorA
VEVEPGVVDVELELLPGGEPAQFWWILGIMLTMSGAMLLLFRRRDWM